MERYRKLRLIREHLALLPGLKSYKDFDISVEIGHYEYLGTPLTLKQLLLLDLAAEATVRRHLKTLIDKGLVIKSINPTDNRSVELKLTDKAHNLFNETLQRLIELVTELA